MKKKVLNCALALFMISSVAWGQERTVSGKVTSSEDGSSLPGVNVVLKGTTNGTVWHQMDLLIKMHKELGL